MADTVEAIMNHEVYSVRADEHAGEVLGMILTLGITAAPVVDERGAPLGLVSLRNLARAQRSAPVSEHMSTPPVTATARTTITEAGRQMGELGYHHLVVVDDDQRVVGFVSSLDVIRGLVGLPASHPPAFAHQEPESGMSWTPTLPLTRENVARIGHQGAGMLVLTHADTPDEVVWAEASNHIAARLGAFISGDHNLPDKVRELLGAQGLCFRAASFVGPNTAGPSVLDVLLER